MLHEQKQELDLALQKYQRALAIDSSHTLALIDLGFLRAKQREFDVAEHYLTSATRSDPTNHRAWFGLGSVLRESQRIEKAVECLIYALELEKTAPVRPFSSIEATLGKLIEAPPVGPKKHRRQLSRV